MMRWQKAQVADLVTRRPHPFERLGDVYLRSTASAELAPPLACADAVQKYAEAKAAAQFEGDFKVCCEQSATDLVVPSSWIARRETKQTMANSRFREQPSLAAPTDVHPTG
jgi:hypothetical protein